MSLYYYPWGCVPVKVLASFSLLASNAGNLGTTGSNGGRLKRKQASADARIRAEGRRCRYFLPRMDLTEPFPRRSC